MALGPSLLPEVVALGMIVKLAGILSMARFTRVIGINYFKIKVRTPCENGILAVNCSPRYNVNTTDLTAYGKVVVNWQVSGMCGDPQESCGIAPTFDNDASDSSIREEDLDGKIATVSFTDEGVDVNDPDNPSKKDLPISDFMNNAGPWALNGLYKPVLKLSFENEITDNDKNVPYLEYQILYGGGPLAASHTVTS